MQKKNWQKRKYDVIEICIEGCGKAVRLMRQKKFPLRKCTGCGEMKPKKELIRVVRGPDEKDENGQIVKKGEISLDLTGKKPGRGAYVCGNPECLRLARKAKRFERAFSCQIPEQVYEKMEEELSRI